MGTKVDRYVEKVVFSVAGNTTRDFLDGSVNAVNRVNGSAIPLSQLFNKLLINNISDQILYYSINRNIDANSSELKDVQVLLPQDGVEFIVPSYFDWLDIRLEGAGEVYIEVRNE